MNLLAKIQMEDIKEMDFTMVKAKLQDSDEGLGWSAETCDQVEEEYKRFLALKRFYPETDIVPNQPVDKFWHQHILDTRKYREDCQEIFGYFLDHFPYFGMRGPEDFQNLERAFEETNRLHEFHFGQENKREQVPLAMARCRTQCKPVKCK